MTGALRILLHHSESADPTLVRWIRDTIDHIFGVGPSVIVVVLGVAIIVFPVAVYWLASRGRKATRRQDPDNRT